ncbi:MAG TPA: CsbD family protein [Polyangiales bacterium]|nr:CsbD family protein [Polyangiales bacterium]
MNWTQVEGKWTQLKGRFQSKWSKLTDDDLTNLQGKKDQILGKIVERYGLAKEDAEKQLDKWIDTLGEEADRKDVRH